MNTEYLTSADWSEWVSEHPSAASAMLHQCLVREQQCLSRELELYLCGDGGINAHADMRRVTWLRKRLADLAAVGFIGTADSQPAYCGMCGNRSSRDANGEAVLCHTCTSEKARIAEERAMYGGPEL